MDSWHDPESAFPWIARMSLSLWCCFEISTCFHKPYGCYRCQRPFNSSAKGLGFFPSKCSLVPKQKYSWNLNLHLCDAGNEEAITWMLHFTVSQITSSGEAQFIPAVSLASSLKTFTFTLAQESVTGVSLIISSARVLGPLGQTIQEYRIAGWHVGANWSIV